MGCRVATTRHGKVDVMVWQMVDTAARLRKQQLRFFIISVLWPNVHYSNSRVGKRGLFYTYVVHHGVVVGLQVETNTGLESQLTNRSDGFFVAAWR